MTRAEVIAAKRTLARLRAKRGRMKRDMDRIKATPRPGSSFDRLEREIAGLCEKLRLEGTKW